MPDQSTFTVIACLRRYAWGAACRLRLDADIKRTDMRWGHDLVGGPMIHKRSFDKPAGWEVAVTLTVPGIKIGDKIPVDDVLAQAQLWTDDSGNATEPRP